MALGNDARDLETRLKQKRGSAKQLTPLTAQ